MFNANPGESCTATAAPSCSLWKTWRKNLLLFCSASVYIELCLHLCVYRSLDRYAVYLLLFGLLGGVLSSLLVSCLPGVARQIAGFLLIAAQVLFTEVQLVYQAIFGNFMPINEISMGGNVVTNFTSQILYSIGREEPFDNPFAADTAACDDPLPCAAETGRAEASAPLAAGACVRWCFSWAAGHNCKSHAFWSKQAAFRVPYLLQREHLHRQQL